MKLEEKRRIEITIPKDMLEILVGGTTVEVEGKDEVWVLRLDATILDVATAAVKAALAASSTHNPNS